METKPMIDAFMAAYGPALAKARSEHPDEYAWPESLLPTVLERMRAALVRGSFNHDGYAMKGACKTLGIKHTRKAIVAYLSGAQS